MISLQLSKIVGTSTERGWSQVHTFLPAEPEKISQRGQLLAVISLEELEEGIETVAAGREIIARLHEEYYGQLDGGPLEQLEKVVRKVAAEVEAEARVEIAAAAVVGEVLYLAIAGQGKLLLQRKGKLAAVLSGGGTASGYLEEGDIFLLGTGKIFAVIAEEALRTALATNSPEEVTEIIIPLIHAQKESGALAGVVAKVAVRNQETPGLPRLDEVGKPRVGEKPSDQEPKRSREWLTKISSLLFRLKRKIKKEKIYLGQRSERQKRSQRMWVTVALILLLILGVSVIFGTWQRKRLSQNKQIAVLLKEARQKKEEGEALLELNPLKAKELLLEAQSLAGEIELKGESNQAAVEFKQELEALLPRVLREHQVEPKVYFDLELIKEGARGDDLAISANQLVILDQGKLAVYNLGVSDRKSTILAGGKKLEGARQVATFWPQVFVLTSEGVIQADQESGGQNLVIEAEEKQEEVVDFRAFGGSLYLLDRGGIWKYPAIEGGFGRRQAWLKTEGIDFSQAVSMAIDGAIWVLQSDGTILKYLQGRKEAFGVAGLNKLLADPIALYTDDEQEKLYILDQSNSRVVVLAKSGEYDSEYSWSGIGEVNSLVASEKEGKIFLVGGSKVYEIQLR